MRRRRWSLVCLLIALTTCAAIPQMASADELPAEVVLQRMQQEETHVRQLLAVARQGRDIVKSLCLANTLTELEASVQKWWVVASRRCTDAMGVGCRNASTTKLLEARAQELSARANACMGQEMAFIATTQVSTGGSARGSPPSAVSLPARPPMSPTAPLAPASSPYASDAPHEASMLAYTADVLLAVFEVGGQMDSVERIAVEEGGYLSQRTDTQVTVRVPRPRFAMAMQRIEQLGDVLHRNVAAEEVTDEYVDLELRLKNARATRDRLLELMKAAGVKDALDIERELAKVAETIETIEGRMKILRDRVGFSTLAVSFQATSVTPVHATSILPFTWLDTIGLAPLLTVTKRSP